MGDQGSLGWDWCWGDVFFLWGKKRKGANGGNFRMNMKVHGQILVKFHEEPRAEKFESQRKKESA